MVFFHLFFVVLFVFVFLPKFKNYFPEKPEFKSSIVLENACKRYLQSNV